MLLPRLFMLTICILTVFACKRHRIPPPENPSTLLRKIEWKNGAREDWKYDNNGKIESTQGVSPASPSIDRDFLYNDRTLGLVQKPSIREDTFFYNAQQRITRIEEYEMGLRQEGGARLDFIYDGNGRVIQMDYGRYKGSDYTPVAVSRYSWSDKGLLLQIDTKLTGKQEEHLFSFVPDDRGYVFEPWAFVNRYLLTDTHYELWNVPVLQCMERLPKRIGWVKKVDGQVAEQKSWEFTQTADRFGRLVRRTAENGDWTQYSY